MEASRRVRVPASMPGPSSMKVLSRSPAISRSHTETRMVRWSLATTTRVFSSSPSASRRSTRSRASQAEHSTE